MIISNTQGLRLGFSLRSTPYHFVGNVNIYSVGTENVYQIIQSRRTEYFAGVSREGLTHKILTNHSCLYLY